VETSQEEIIVKMDAGQAKIDDCLEKTEAYLETKEPIPEKIESELEHWRGPASRHRAPPTAEETEPMRW
jgi:hypothetical protein